MSNVILGPVALQSEIDRLTPDIVASQSLRRAETLVKRDDLRVVLIIMAKGGELAEHLAPGTITVQVLSGTISFTVDGTNHEMNAGDIISLETNITHAVKAETDASFLLTIGWSANASHPPI